MSGDTYKEVLMDIFLPKLTSLDLTSDEKDLMCKPLRHLDIGIVDPVCEALLALDNSQECTKMLTDAIRTGIVIDCDAYEHESNVKKQQARLLKNVKQQEAVVEILRSVSLCIRGSRTKWRGAGFTHDAALPLHFYESD